MKPVSFLTSTAAILLACFQSSTPSASALTLHTDFPGGSAEVRSVDAASGRIEITPSHHEGRGWPCWWYFRVEGARPGQRLTLFIGPSSRPFRAQQRLAVSWALPHQPVISLDDAVWNHLPTAGVLTKEGGTYEITAPAERFWLAWGPPFLPAHAEALLADTAARVPGAERFELAQTRGSRPVPGIRLGNRDAPQAVWVQARQHAWETGSSWVSRGFLEWVAGDHPEAAALREQAEIFLVPIMDVDSVTLGAGGKEADPRDHNRDWASEPIYPEVAAAQSRLLDLAQTGRLRVFLDLHNPGPGDKRTYFFGPFGYEQMHGARRAAYDRFLELTAAAMTGELPFHPEYRFANYIKTEEERARMSAHWMRLHSAETTLALTLEAAWNTPNSTSAGYRETGAGLARAVARYVAGPR